MPKGHNYNIDIHLRTILDRGSGNTMSNQFKSVVNQLVEMAKEAGYQIDQALYTSTGKLDFRKINQIERALQNAGLSIQGNFDGATGALRSFQATLKSFGNNSWVKQGFTIDGEDIISQTKTIGTAWADLGSEINRVYGEMGQASKRATKLMTQDANDVTGAYAHTTQRLEDLKGELKDLMARAQQEGYTVENGLVQGEDSFARQARRAAYGYQAVIDDTQLRKMQQYTNLTNDVHKAEAELMRGRASGKNNEWLAAQQEMVDLTKERVSNFENLNEGVADQAKQTQSYIDQEKQWAIEQKKFTADQQETTTELKKTESFFGRIKNSIAKMTTQVFMAGIAWKAFAAITRSLKQSVEIIKNLDKAITDLRIATGYSTETMQQMVKQYNQMAQELGATTTEVADSANTWLRMGYSAKDTNTLIKNSMVLSKVGMLESSEATQYLVSAMKGFNITAQESISIVDKLAAVDLESVTYCKLQYSCVYYVNSIYFSLNCWQSLKSIKLQHKTEQV